MALTSIEAEIWALWNEKKLNTWEISRLEILSHRMSEAQVHRIIRDINERINQGEKVA